MVLKWLVTDFQRLQKILCPVDSGVISANAVFSDNSSDLTVTVILDSDYEICEFRQ